MGHHVQGRRHHRSDEVEIEVHAEPDHVPDVVRSDRPVLTYGHHAFYGDCWTLWYRDEYDCVDQNCIPGSVADEQAAVRLAQDFLAPLLEVTA